jgi:prepilin-type N-terminal cleavage/methylation domain-containing protein
MKTAHRIGCTPRQGLTLIEVLVAIGITAVLVALGLPSMQDWMIRQRVISTASEIVSDMRFAKSESISQNLWVKVRYSPEGNGCYTIFRIPSDAVNENCDCSLGAGKACSQTSSDAPFVELKTYTAPPTGNVAIKAPVKRAHVFNSGAFLNSEEIAGLEFLVTGGEGKDLKVVMAAGIPHPTICAPAGSTITGYKACP